MDRKQNDDDFLFLFIRRPSFCTSSFNLLNVSFTACSDLAIINTLSAYAQIWIDVVLMLPFKSSFLIIKIKLPILWIWTKKSGITDAVEHFQLQCFWYNYTLFLCTIYVDHQKRMTLAGKRCIGEQRTDSFTAYITFGLCPFSLWPKFFTTTFQKLIHMYSLISKRPMVLLYTHKCNFISVHKNMAFSAPIF